MIDRILPNYTERCKRIVERIQACIFSNNCYWLIWFLLTTLPARAQSAEQRDPIQFILPKKSALVYQNGYIGRLYTTNVKAQHHDTVLFSDRVFYRDSTDELTASGHVLLVQADSVVARADTLDYRGSGQQATLRGRVTFQHRQIVVTATRIDYEVLTGTIFYARNARITDGKTVRISPEGFYDCQTRRFTSREGSWLARSADAVAPIAPVRLASATNEPAEVSDGLTRKLSSGPVADMTRVEPSNRPVRSAVARRALAGNATPTQRQPPAQGGVRPAEQAQPGRMLVRVSREITAEPVSAAPPADTTVSDLERILNGKKH